MAPIEPNRKRETISAYSTTVTPRAPDGAESLPTCHVGNIGTRGLRLEWNPHGSLGSSRITARSRMVTPVPGKILVM